MIRVIERVFNYKMETKEPEQIKNYGNLQKPLSLMIQLKQESTITEFLTLLESYVDIKAALSIVPHF